MRSAAVRLLPHGATTEAALGGAARAATEVLRWTPVGIVIGIGISSVYNENSSTALVVQGFFDSAAAGILIYMALVDLLAVDYMNPRMQNSGKLQFWVTLSLLVGAGCMSVMAIWA